MGFGVQEDMPGLQHSFERVKSILDKTIADGIPASNIVVGGFSQGGAIALHTAMRLTYPIAGYATLSAWLALIQSYPAEMSAAAKSANIFMVRNGALLVEDSSQDTGDASLHLLPLHTTHTLYLHVNHTTYLHTTHTIYHHRPTATKMTSSISNWRGPRMAYWQIF